MKRIKCTYCKGTGKWEIQYGYIMEFARCPSCDGSRFIYVDESTEAQSQSKPNGT